MNNNGWKQPIPVNLIEVCHGHKFASTVLEKLLLRARQKKGYVYFDDEPILLERGQCFCGRFELAEWFGLKKAEAGRIRNVLDFLVKSAKQITKRKAQNGSIITILYFDKYTSLDQTDDQTETKRKPNGNQTETTNKIVKSVKSGKHEKKTLSPELFEQLWKNYPRKLGKKKSLIAFNRTVKTPIDEKNIETALNIFIETMRKEGRSSEYIPHGSTWFGNWQDWTDYKTQEQTKSEATKIPLMKMEN